MRNKAGIVPFEPPVSGTCFTCVWWQLVVDRSPEGYQDEGLCRRHPPVAVASPRISDAGTDAMGAPGFVAAWPRTFSESDWCGDYKTTADIAGRRTP